MKMMTMINGKEIKIETTRHQSLYTHTMDTPCCIYNRICDASFYVYPKDGIWNGKTQYEIMMACEEDDDLKGVHMPSCVEGGFAWEGTDESSKLWHDTTISQTDPIVIKKDREIRTYNSSRCGAFTGYWRDTLFTETKNIAPRHMIPWAGRSSINCFQCRAKGNPSLGMVIKLLKIFRDQGHLILGTTGFKINANGGVKICKNKSIQNKMHLKELRYIIKPGDMA